MNEKTTMIHEICKNLTNNEILEVIIVLVNKNWKIGEDPGYFIALD